MKNKGQVFTTDMIFALILVAALLSISTQVYGIASEGVRSHSTRYSLERMTNDVADVLVKTAGDPIDWKINPNLETLGLAKVGRENKAIPNYLDEDKIVRLATALQEEPVDNSIKEFFGGTKNFEIKIEGKENMFWHFWPGWANEKSSGAENSLEVATVTRLIYVRPGDVRYRSDPIYRYHPGDVGTKTFYDNFHIYDGEIESHDWYIVIRVSENEKERPRSVTVHVQGDGTQFKEEWNPIPETGATKVVRPELHGGMENFSAQPQVGTNRLKTEIKQDKDDKEFTQWAQLFVIGLPHCSPPERALQALEKIPALLQVKMWR